MSDDDNIEYNLDDEHYELENIIQSKTNTNIRKLNNFIEKFVVKKDETEFNIIDQGYKKKYNIPNSDVKDFFIYLDKCRQDSLIINYCERQNNNCGIMIDIDRHQENDKRVITNRHFDKLINIVFTRLCEIIEFPINQEVGYSNEEVYSKNNEVEFYAFIIQKDKPVLADNKNYEGKYKDGFHLLIPEIQIKKEVKKYLLKQMVDHNDMSKVFNDINHTEDPNIMLDTMSAGVVVLFYGNSKKNKPPYKLAYCLKVTLDLELKKPSLVAVQDLTNIKDNNLSYELSLGFYLEELNNKSTWLNKKKYECYPNLDIKVNQNHDEYEKNISEDSLSVLTLHDPEAAFMQKILSVLPAEYVTDYNKWFNVLCAIANTDKNYKPLAMWFSKRNFEKFNQVEFEKYWLDACNNLGNKDPITKRSLLHWVRQSNYEKYRETTINSYSNMLKVYTLKYEGDIRHAMIAKILHRMLGDKFITDVSGATYYWFEFIIPGQHMEQGEVFKWRKEVDPDTIHKYISEHLPKIYVQTLEMIKNNKIQAESKELTKYWKRIESIFKKSMCNLHDDGYQKGIIRQSRLWFRQRGFIKKLDKDPDILGVGNGILKLGENPQLIRGFHEYKVSLYTSTEYYPYDPNNPHIKFVENAFRDVFIEHDVYEWMWFYFSLSLDGHMVQPIILFLYGCGCNGKSFVFELISNTLGDHFAKKIPISLLTDKREKASEANSAFVELDKKRMVYASEPNKSEVLNTARIKEIVSPEKQSGRGLYEQQKQFDITANMTCGSNHKFIINCTDHGIWRRIRFYCNKTKFCENPDPDNKFEKKDDPNFAQNYVKDVSIQQATLSILTHYNKRLRTEFGYNIKNVPCKTMEYETEKYRNEQDTVNCFVSQMLVKSQSHNVDYSINSLALAYIQWYNLNRQPIAHDTQDIINQLENSRIAKGFSRSPNDSLTLKGYRLLENAGCELFEDETYIIPKRPNESVLKKNNKQMSDIDSMLS